MRVKFLAQWNKGGLWWGSNSRPTGIHRSGVRRATHCATPPLFYWIMMIIFILISLSECSNRCSYAEIELKQRWIVWHPRKRGHTSVCWALYQLFVLYQSNQCSNTLNVFYVETLHYCSITIRVNYLPVHVCSGVWVIELFLFKHIKYTHSYTVLLCFRCWVKFTHIVTYALSIRLC